MTEHTHSILAHKDYLPSKARKSNFPQIVWIEAPEHKNFCNNDLRREFNACLNDIVHFHDNTLCLPLKKIWDSSNAHLFIEEYSRFSSEGYMTYWSAVDCTIKFADTILWSKAISPKKPKKKSFIPWSQDKYHLSKRSEDDRKSFPYHRRSSGDTHGFHLPNPYK